MATQEHTQQDNTARLELSRQANLEIFKMAEAAAEVCQDDDRPIFHGMMARIKTLSEIVYYAQRLHGESEGDEPDMQALERVFKGMMAYRVAPASPARLLEGA